MISRPPRRTSSCGTTTYSVPRRYAATRSPTRTARSSASYWSCVSCTSASLVAPVEDQRFQNIGCALDLGSIDPLLRGVGERDVTGPETYRWNSRLVEQRRIGPRGHAAHGHTFVAIDQRGRERTHDRRGRRDVGRRLRKHQRRLCGE